MDDENRENGGDLLRPVATATPMVGTGSYGPGTDPNGTAFAVSVEQALNRAGIKCGAGDD